jgi:predicted ester cyclase
MDANKENARRWFEEVFSNGNLVLIPELIAPEYVNHDTNVPGGVWRGLEGANALIDTYRSPWPDVRFTVEDQVTEGDRVVTRWSATGSHTAPFGKISATGKKVVFTGINVKRIVNGKAVEEWVNFDLMGLLQQLGAIPASGQRGKAHE